LFKAQISAKSLLSKGENEMNKRFALFLLILLSIAAFTTVVGSASAQATRTSFESPIILDIGEPERVWVGGGITHVRNQPYLNLNPMFIAGVEVEVSGLANFNFSSDGDGTDYGTVVITAKDGSGSWVGRFSGIIRSGLISNHFIAQGSGAFAGTTIQGTYVESAPLTGIFSGEILHPAGN
jgi:hypothetical protein